ncbi:acyl-CoA carboxylase subunit epsilon [Kitasatospora sp. NPDC052896]|uniref:acyl-CoA carboxylase subunit epsilon n=1 Tax=Kitasatospora sp. NPDC052896 TaxID=3364061 RepID=UPI0037C53FAE
MSRPPVTAPVLRVLHGNPSPAELAAVTAVLLGAARGTRRTAPSAPTRTVQWDARRPAHRIATSWHTDPRR